MLDPIIEDVNREFVLQSNDILKFCLDWQADTGGRFSNMDGRLDRLLPYIQFYKVNCGESKILWCGDKSTVCQLYGESFAAEAPGRTGIPDTEFEFILSAAYHEVDHTKDPVYQFVRSNIDVWGTPYEITYCRAVFPIIYGATDAIGVMSRFLMSPIQLDSLHLHN